MDRRRFLANLFKTTICAVSLPVATKMLFSQPYKLISNTIDWNPEKIIAHSAMNYGGDDDIYTIGTHQFIESLNSNMNKIMEDLMIAGDMA